MSVSWEYFTKRRRVDVKAWLSKNKVKTYADFSRQLKGLGVTPPAKKVFDKMLADLGLAQKKTVRKPKPKKAAVRKTSTKKTES